MALVDIIASLFVFTGTGLGWFLWDLRREHLRSAPKKARATPGPEDITHLDWCDGCDQVRSSRSMDFTETGLYRCAQCRGVEEPKSNQQKYWEERKARSERIELSRGQRGRPFGGLGTGSH